MAFSTLENIVFSDSLDVKKAVALAKAAAKAGVGCSMGVGTFFTNDFTHREQPNKQNAEGTGPLPTETEKSKPLNM